MDFEVNSYSTPLVKYAVNGHFKDIMGGASRIEASVHKHGLVALTDCMPRLVWIDNDAAAGDINTAEVAIVQAARVSYGKGTKKVSEDRGLVRYMMRNDHNTPLEMIETKWHCKMPIFVARQWIRHRTASVNEISARYSELPGEFWIPKPEDIREQSNKNKQVSEGQMNKVTAEHFVLSLNETCETAYEAYQTALNQGIGREIARVGLPLNIYTEWYWKIDLHNLFHFLKLRINPHAQKEIRDYAVPMLEMVRMIAPHAVEAFEDYRVNSITLSGPEISAIRDGVCIVGTNKRENEEFFTKRRLLGLAY